MNFKVGDEVQFIANNELVVGTIKHMSTQDGWVDMQASDSRRYFRKSKDVVRFKKTELIVVPQCVADWYEQHRYKLEHSIWQYIYCWDVQKRKSDFYNFMKNDNLKPIETLIKMKDGYEVEKEPLYYVKLPYFGYVTNRMDYTLSQSKTDAVMLTESKIKRMDERYWKFAVLVEEAEGEA
ncbi:DUF1642 domain-containing protein [Listeria monocytogenes]